MCRRATGILLMILLFLSGCSPPTRTASVAVQTPTLTSPLYEPPPGVPSATPDAVLTHVQGEVRLQQVITGQVVLASFGDHLWRGDVIVTEQDAQAEALCSDGDSIRVEPNQSLTVICGETPDPVYQRIILRIHGGQIEALPTARSDPPDYGNLPVVLSPRNTHITNGRPGIRWLAVEEAEDYEVAVRRLDSKLWQATAQETELPYPDAQPALEAGVTYLIQVTARMGSAEERSSEPVMVTVLSAAGTEQVHQFEAQVEALGLSAESVRFSLAAYYAELELYDAAIVELVSLAGETPSPLVHRLLGDAYLAVVLDGEAAQSYEKARRLAQEQDNRLVQAEAEVGLGHVAYAAKEFEQALSHYQVAQTLYQELGLESDAEAVEELVASTEARLPTPTP
jgi:hypothetical protein